MRGVAHGRDYCIEHFNSASKRQLSLSSEPFVIVNLIEMTRTQSSFSQSRSSCALN